MSSSHGREQRDRGAVGVGDDEGVEEHDRARDEVRDPARAPQQRVEQPHDPPRSERQEDSEPQSLHDPVWDAERVPDREERSHREQVAGLLPALDIAELTGRRPHRRHVGEKPAGIDVKVDLRVGRRQPGALGERERKRPGAEEQGNACFPATSPHRRGA